MTVATPNAELEEFNGRMFSREWTEYQQRQQEFTRRDIKEGREPRVDAATVASIQTVFSRTRLSFVGWKNRQIEGRLSGREAWRNDARGHTDIFRDRRAPSPTKLNVWVLVDGSGSMQGPRIRNAQDMAATLVHAFKRVPGVKMHVWQHATSGKGIQLFRIYEPGMGLAKLRDMVRLGMSGNGDGYALQWVGNRALQLARKDEKVLVIVISDGEPSAIADDATIVNQHRGLEYHVKAVAEELRDKGAVVTSIAIAGNSGSCNTMYGAANNVPFLGWDRVGRDLAALFGGLVRRGIKAR